MLAFFDPIRLRKLVESIKEVIVVTLICVICMTRYVNHLKSALKQIQQGSYYEPIL